MNEEININKKEAVKTLYTLIDTRTKLTIQINKLIEEWNKQHDEHVKKSIELLYNDLVLLLKRTNKRITLLDNAIKEGVIQ
jgi:hypothetical protein